MRPDRHGSRPPRRRLWLPGAATLAIGAAAVLVLRFGRGFFWPHAVISGLAVAALAYSAWRTWTILGGTPSLGARQAAPRKDEERGDEEEMNRSSETEPEKQELDPRRESSKRHEEADRHDGKG